MDAELVHRRRWSFLRALGHVWRTKFFAGSRPCMFYSAIAVRRLVFRPGAPLLNVEDVVLGILLHVLFGRGNRVSCYERESASRRRQP